MGGSGFHIFVSFLPVHLGLHGLVVLIGINIDVHGFVRFRDSFTLGVFAHYGWGCLDWWEVRRLRGVGSGQFRWVALFWLDSGVLFFLNGY